MPGSPLVAVVDDDESVRESLPELLAQLGFAVQVFASAEDFLASLAVAQTHCLILDIAMPGMSGPELQDELRTRRLDIPIVFITGQRDAAIGPRMMERGAIDVLAKPFSEAALLRAVNAALRIG